MRKLWNFINQCNIKAETKNTLFIFMQIIKYTILGGAIWLIAGKYALPEIPWFICFMGYPAVGVGLFGSILYLYNHEFENGSKGKENFT